MPKGIPNPEPTPPNGCADAARWLDGEISLSRFIHNSGLESCHTQAMDFAGGIANVYEERMQKLKEQRNSIVAGGFELKQTAPGKFWLCAGAGEGMETSEAKIAALLRTFFEREF